MIPNPDGNLHVYMLSVGQGDTTVIVSPEGRVLVIDGSAAGKVVWQVGGLNRPNDAQRLPDGNTLVGEGGRVREFDAKGLEVREIKLGQATSVSRY